jgi:hypothetical protein
MAKRDQGWDIEIFGLNQDVYGRGGRRVRLSKPIHNPDDRHPVIEVDGKVYVYAGHSMGGGMVIQYRQVRPVKGRLLKESS